MSGRFLRWLRRGFELNYERSLGVDAEVIAFAFHGLFRDFGEWQEGIVHPQQRLTVSDLRALIDEFSGGGYGFLKASEVAEGQPRKKRNVVLTFDDAYATALRAVPVLEEFSVPATFFVSSWHAQTGRPFWWDVQYRERHSQHWAHEEIVAEEQWLHTKTTDFIEEYMVGIFGCHALEAGPDEGRPMNADEVRRLAAHPLAEIGNHTCRHVRLSRCQHARKQSEIEEAQRDLENMTGRVPLAIAYPHGDLDEETISLCRAAKLRVGFTTEHRTERMGPGRLTDMLRLGRVILVRRASERFFMDEFRPDLVQYLRFRARVRSF